MEPEDYKVVFLRLPVGRPKFLFCQKCPVPSNKNITAELHYPVNQSRYISVDFISTIKLKTFSKPFIIFENLRWLCDLET